MHPNLSHKQAGVALILSLLILLVMTLVGVAAMSGINLQERMAGNQKRMADAQMAAEAGAKSFYAWLNEDPENRWGSDNWTAEAWGTESGELHSDYSRFRVDSVCWDVTPPDICTPPPEGLAVVETTGRAVAGDATRGEFRVQVVLENRIISLSMDPAFGHGILSDKQIRLNGNVEITDASVHSNYECDRERCGPDEAAVRVTGGRSTIEDGMVTGVGDVDVPDSMCDDCVVSPADPLDIPLITEEILADWWDQASLIVDPPTGTITGTPPPEGSSVSVDEQGNCVFELDGSQSPDPDNPTLYYCAGNAILSGDFTNATIIVDGDVTHGGAVRPGGDIDTSEGTTTNFIAATGDITFNGASGGRDAYFEGIFWANGSVIQNGRAYIYGSIVAGGETEGDIWFGGRLNFAGINDTSNPFVPADEAERLAINAWRQIW